MLCFVFAYVLVLFSVQLSAGAFGCVLDPNSGVCCVEYCVSFMVSPLLCSMFLPLFFPLVVFFFIVLFQSLSSFLNVVFGFTSSCVLGWFLGAGAFLFLVAGFGWQGFACQRVA